MGHQTSDVWYQEATAVIDSILGVSEVLDLQISKEVATIERRALRSTLSLGLVLIGILVVVTFAGVFVSRRILQPLAELGNSADLFASGNLDRPVTVSGPDEIGDLGRAFEAMRRALGAHQTEQQRLIERLTDTKAQLLQAEKLASVGQLAAGVP